MNYHRISGELLAKHLNIMEKSPTCIFLPFIFHNLRKLQTNSWWVPSPMPFPQVHNLSRQGLDQGFSTMALLTFWVGSFFILEEGLVHRRMFSNIPGLSSLDASSNLFSQTWQPIVSRWYQVFPWEQNYSTPRENQRLRRRCSTCSCEKDEHLREACHVPGPAPGMKGTTPNNQRPYPSGGGGGGNDNFISKWLVQSVWWYTLPRIESDGRTKTITAGVRGGGGTALDWVVYHWITAINTD